VAQAHDVYECQEIDGTFLAAAHSLGEAAEVVLALQLALLEAPWPSALLEKEDYRVVWGSGGLLECR
jgi:hypothetical protein